MNVCHNCGGITPYMRTLYLIETGEEFEACSNACERTLMGEIGEPWRWLDKDKYADYIAEHPDCKPETKSRVM